MSGLPIFQRSDLMLKNCICTYTNAILQHQVRMQDCDTIGGIGAYSTYQSCLRFEHIEFRPVLNLVAGHSCLLWFVCQRNKVDDRINILSEINIMAFLVPWC